MSGVQETHTYFAVYLFSYLRAITGGANYIFTLQVDSAARLWVDNELIINATCKTYIYFNV